MINIDIIFCPGGATSQTGTAVAERYPGCSISSCGKILDVFEQLESNAGPYALPIWNSHQGEVEDAKDVWKCIEESKIKISDIWAKKIEFWFLKRTVSVISYGIIGSVKVAKTQCSAFLEQKSAQFKGYPLTNDALQAFQDGAELDGVLITPNQCEHGVNYEVAATETANPNNFTSFVTFVPTRAFDVDFSTANSVLTGITMGALGSYSSDAERSLFEKMFHTVTDLNHIPKLIFVFDRDSRVGLLFEGKRLDEGDLADADEIERDELSIHGDAGATTRCYTEELRELFRLNFPSLNSDDFIVHHGVDTCLFACPPLDLYTHGYNADAVERAVRYYISELFQCWTNGGMTCTAEQDKFFERYKDSWEENRSEFMQFKPISPTGGNE